MPRRPYPANRRPNPAALMMTLRQWHGYIGAFIAPSVLFFAFTGVLQLFSLHEAHDGYTPPALVAKLSAVHKDQVFVVKDHDGPPPGAHSKGDSDHDAAGPAGAKGVSAAQIRTWILKWVFALVGAGLIGSTLVGLWLAFTQSRGRIVNLVLFLIGAAAPILLLAL